MDTRLLTLGKFDIKKPPLNRYSKAILSECYFDWVQLKIYDFGTEDTADQEVLTSCKRIFRHDILLKDSFSFGNDDVDVADSFRGHLQESMLLVSEEDSTTFLFSPECVYISMINIPMWDEELFSSSQDYSTVRKKIFCFIEGLLEPTTCRLYHTFDHCDFVLVADGTKISFSDFMGILKNIRNHCIEIGEKRIFSVLDITTIYGYTNEYLNHNCISDEKLNMVLELSFKRLAYDNTLIKKFSCYPSRQIKAVGRYDTILCWDSITLNDFNSIIFILRNEEDKFFTYKVILGFNDYREEINSRISDVSDGDMKAFTFSRSRIFIESEKTFVPLYNRLKEKGLRSVLLNALFEIQNSVRAMLKNGFAQYYILSFYESFYSFMAFIERVLDEANSCGDRSEEQKEHLEKIDDSFRDYFGLLNALNACTIHSERQFLQTDSYQLLYYDALPKLIAFYTAIANKIASVVEQDTQNHYTFLITPDFKEDIFVDSITEDHTVNNELNILIIHIDEESLYNVTSTITTIIHEIFHHIGQNSELRSKRAFLYQKCCLAYILARNIPYELLVNQSGERSPYELFEKIVELFFKKYKELPSLDDKTYTNLEFNKEQSEHYLDYLIYVFLNKIENWFDTDDFTFVEDILNQVFTKPELDVVDCFEDSISLINMHDQEQKVLTVYSNRIIARALAMHINNWLVANTDKETYSHIRHTFRESFADTQMLNLVQGSVDDYLKMIIEFGGEKNTNEITRIVSVLKHNHRYDHSWVKTFREKTLQNDSYSDIQIKQWIFLEPFDKENAFFYWYLSENVVEYLSNLNNILSNLCIIDLSNEISRIIKILESGSINDIIQMIDTEIFEYRNRLLGVNT